MPASNKPVDVTDLTYVKQYVDENDNDALPKWCNAAQGYIKGCYGEGRYNYYKIGTITTSGSWINYPLVFAISGRGISYSVIEIMFQSTDSTDPRLSHFRTSDDNRFWIKKTDTSTWEVYGMYSEPWGGAFLHQVTGCTMNIIFNVSMTNIQQPLDCTQVVYGGNAHYADTAALATSANSTGLLVHGQDAPITSESELNNEATYSNDGITYKIISIADYYIIPNVYANGFILSIPWTVGGGKYLRQFFIDDDRDTPICVRTYTSNSGFSAWKALAFSEEIPDTRGTQTVSGNPITVADAESMNAESVVVELEPKQDLHGYDAPWVGGSGKNLYNKDDTNGHPGEVLEVSDGSLTSNYYFTSSDYISMTAGEDVVLSASNNNNVICAYNASKNFISGTSNYVEGTNIPLVFTLPTNTAFVRVSYETNVIDTAQLERGSTATTFAPYSNICPITGYGEVNVERVGKNLIESTLPYTTIESNGTINTSTVSPTYDMHIAKIIQGETYTIQSDQSEDVNRKFVGGFFYDMPQVGSVSYNNARLADAPATFTAPIDGYVAFRTNHNYAFAQIVQSNTYTIDLDGTRYGGTLDVTEGVLTVTHGSVTESDFTYQYTYQYGKSGGGLCWADYYTNDVVSNGSMCSELQMLMSAWGSTTPCYNIVDNVRIRVYGNFTSQQNFEDMYAGLQVVYKLATPLTIQLTPTQIQMLENTNNISTDGTNIQLKYQPNNVIGECKQYTDAQCAKIPKYTETLIWENPTPNQKISNDYISNLSYPEGDDIIIRAYYKYKYDEIAMGLIDVPVTIASGGKRIGVNKIETFVSGITDDDDDYRLDNCFVTRTMVFSPDDGNMNIPDCYYLCANSLTTGSSSHITGYTSDAIIPVKVTAITY